MKRTIELVLVIMMITIAFTTEAAQLTDVGYEFCDKQDDVIQCVEYVKECSSTEEICLDNYFSKYGE